MAAQRLSSLSGCWPLVLQGILVGRRSGGGKFCLGLPLLKVEKTTDVLIIHFAPLILSPVFVNLAPTPFYLFYRQTIYGRSTCGAGGKHWKVFI